MFTRFNGNVVPFADDATSTNRTVFGGTTQSDLIDDNLNTNFKKGWEIVGLNDNPTREDFNGMGYTLGALTAYLYEMGISEWNASQNYRVNSRTTGSDGKIYKSLTGTIGIPNVGNNPTTDAVNWQVENITDYSSLTNKTTPVDADLIPLSDSAASFGIKKLTWANLKGTLSNLFAPLLSPAFAGNPTAPTQTAQDNSNKIATTAYVDGKMILGTVVNATGTAIDFTGIPSWAKKITIMFNNLSANVGGNILFQIGDSGGIENTGYVNAGMVLAGTGNVYFTSANGHPMSFDTAADYSHGELTISLINGTTYSFILNGDLTNRTILHYSSGVKSLTTTLDRIRVTTISGTASFDSGQINIRYEG